MKTLLVNVFLLFFMLQLESQDVAALIKEANRFEDIPNEKAAFA